jgi:threonine/homoserine/homoserine lactone efflux protein
MLTYQISLTFFGVAIVLALSPGPDNLFVLMQSALWGRRAGLIVVFGLCTALIAHTAAVAIGLAAVFAASATAFTVIKLLGAAYLVYLAWSAFSAGVGASPDRAPPQQTPWQLYRRGVIMNLTNPKVSIFFLAFLPQFTSPARGSLALQTFALGALFMLATLLVFGGIAFFSGVFGEKIQRSARARRWLNRAAGAIFLGLAFKLTLTQR